jgi:hypothetical protein
MSGPPPKPVTYGERVYEYVTEEGIKVYSFERLPSKVSPPTRLILKSRIGTHIQNFVIDLRRKGKELARGYDGEDGTR